MKKWLHFILMVLLIFTFSGCKNTEASDVPEKSTVISQAIANISSANSYDCTVLVEEIDSYGNKKAESRRETEQKLIFEPFTMWNKTDTLMTNVSNEKSRTFSEVYETVHDGTMDFKVRYSRQEGADINKNLDLSNWEGQSYQEKEQIDLTVKMNRNYFDAELYLLSSNIDSFQLAENAADVDKNTLKYDGSIKQATVLEAYQKYLRDLYVQMKMVAALENPSLEDLKNEIISGERPELQSGIPKLAYSEVPIPVSLWIDQDTFTLKKVTIDETSAMQSLLEKEIPKIDTKSEVPTVTKALTTYEIKSLDKLTEIPVPE